ncbi:2-hydroxy-3-oxopropionate reductase [Delftia tsuruhatensis]|uniref:NAD(P)-dependent oxidoreductase n=1 Tax=Delftia tsuruhatensis TaxID=180282 RepID=UPI001E6EC149|nr:NAD(P)-dependent oxidoreductase [Delftia tsuruhatensis]CAB5713696.1 2-hydroxy-3-oxopropionate reductase [Delftia tsuruhatensis]CAC9688708.1 2-hydroxy-3-oxopropionate reductase [Delftia tsuruhatensis]
MTVLGFIGVGVMGAGMCAHLARKSGARVLAADRCMDGIHALAGEGVQASSLAQIAREAQTVFLSLPSIAQVESVCLGEDGLAAHAGALRTIVDMGTSDVERTRALARQLAQRGIDLVDAPVARSREAAAHGTLLITVGAEPAQFEALKPWLACMGSDVLHCGPVGCGQVVKIMNNMVLLDTVHALAQAFAIAERAGVSRALLGQALELGSAASFALRLTGANHLARDVFPEKMFSAAYALKDMGLALSLSDAVGLPNEISQSTAAQLQRCVEAGYAHSYYPVMVRVIAGQGQETA